MKLNVGEALASVFAVWFFSSRRNSTFSSRILGGAGELRISGTWFCILTIAQSFPQSPHPKTLYSGFCEGIKGIYLEKIEFNIYHIKPFFLCFPLCSSICSAHGSPDGGLSEHHEPVLAASRKTQRNHSGLWDQVPWEGKKQCKSAPVILSNFIDGLCIITWKKLWPTLMNTFSAKHFHFKSLLVWSSSPHLLLSSHFSVPPSSFVFAPPAYFYYAVSFSVPFPPALPLNSEFVRFESFCIFHWPRELWLLLPQGGNNGSHPDLLPLLFWPFSQANTLNSSCFTTACLSLFTSPEWLEWLSLLMLNERAHRPFINSCLFFLRRIRVRPLPIRWLRSGAMRASKVWRLVPLMWYKSAPGP